MTTKELHIELDISLQKLNSNYNKNLEPEEKDIIINNGIIRFIKNRINPRSNAKGLGFDETFKRLEDLNTLVESKPIKVLYTKDNVPYYKLPYDFLYYIDSNAKVKCFNNTVRFAPIDEYSAILKDLNKSLKSTSLSIDIIIEGRPFNLFNSSTLPDNYLDSSTIYKDATDFVINNTIEIKIKQAIQEQTIIENTTEYFKDLEFKFDNTLNRFKLRHTKDFAIVINEEIRGLTNNQVITATKNTNNFINTVASLKATCNFKERDKFSVISSNHLSGSPEHNLVYRLKDHVYFNSINCNFYPIEVNLTYIRKPKKVSLLLDNNSELDSEVLLEVLADVDRNLKGILSMDAYEKTFNEFTLIE